MRKLIIVALATICLAAIRPTSVQADGKIWGYVDYTASCSQQLGDVVVVSKPGWGSNEYGIGHGGYWETYTTMPPGTYYCGAKGGDRQQPCCKVGSMTYVEHGSDDTRADDLLIGCDGTPTGGGDQ